MKKNIFKLIALFAMFISVNTFAQSSTTKVLVTIGAATQTSQLMNLTNGKMNGFSKEDKAVIVIPNNDDKATLANLEAEIKKLLPASTITIRKEEK